MKIAKQRGARLATFCKRVTGARRSNSGSLVLGRVGRSTNINYNTLQAHTQRHTRPAAVDLCTAFLSQQGNREKTQTSSAELLRGFCANHGVSPAAATAVLAKHVPRTAASVRPALPSVAVRRSRPSAAAPAPAAPTTHVRRSRRQPAKSAAIRFPGQLVGQPAQPVLAAAAADAIQPATSAPEFERKLEPRRAIQSKRQQRQQVLYVRLRERRSWRSGWCSPTLTRPVL